MVSRVAACAAGNVAWLLQTDVGLSTNVRNLTNSMPRQVRRMIGCATWGGKAYGYAQQIIYLP